jgi:hypothetical protein
MNATIFVDFGKLIWQLQNLVNFEKLMFKPFFGGKIQNLLITWIKLKG